MLYLTNQLRRPFQGLFFFGKAETNNAVVDIVALENGYRYSGHTHIAGHTAHKLQIALITYFAVRNQLKVSALALKQFESR